MKKNLMLLFLALTIVQQAYSQNNDSKHLLRATTGVSGYSSSISINNKNYIIQQSIGQTSTIGTFETNDYTVRQGFIQPNVMSKIMDKDIPLNLNVIVFPNPFTENISLSFNEEIGDEVTVSLFDLLGRMLFTNKYKANKNINITLEDLSVAYYILKVNTKKRQFLKKIIKK